MKTIVEKLVSKDINEAASTLLELVAQAQADAAHANAKNAELIQTVKELRATLNNKARSFATKDTKITQLRAQVAYYKAHTLRYQSDLAEARSLLRKVQH